MNYEGQICRAPMERSSYMLPIMVGCSYNSCRFCNLFRHLKFRALPMEEIEAECARVEAVGGSPKRIFLGDGSAFVFSAEYLLEIIERVRKHFPEVREFRMDATVQSVRAKTDKELSVLARAGVSHLYLGIESGLEDVLLFMNKGNTLAEAEEAIRRLHAAGIEYDAHIMTGIAGKGRGLENASALAEFLNRTKPAHIVNFSLFLHEEVPLYEEVKRGAFRQADELETLREERYLIELLAAKGDCEFQYDGFHDFIEVRTRGTLPRDREKMLRHLDEVIAAYEKKAPVYSVVCGQCPDVRKSETGEELWNMT